MELSKFVQEVLSEVVAGVRAAQEGAHGAFIVPSGDGGHVYAANTRVAVSARLKSTIVDFDIAVTAEDAIKGGAEGGIKVLGIGAKANGDLSSKDIVVSRIQFAVPILLPQSQRNWHQELTGTGTDAA